MKHIRIIIVLTVTGFALLLATGAAYSQSSSADTGWHGAFNKGSMLLGPHIGLAAFGSAPAFGVNFETGVTEPGKAGPGVIGISGRVDYFGFSEIDWKYTWIAVGVFANYHFAVNTPWDPFLGIGLGYQNVSVSWTGASGEQFGSGAWGSGVYFSGDAGIRYFFSPTMAARAQLGFGVTYLVLGLDFGL